MFLVIRITSLVGEPLGTHADNYRPIDAVADRVFVSEAGEATVTQHSDLFLLIIPIPRSTEPILRFLAHSARYDFCSFNAPHSVINRFQCTSNQSLFNSL